MAIIAIDGPAASGKGTLARRLAAHYGFHHLDTGLTYRAVAKALIDEELPLDQESIAKEMAQKVDVDHLERNVLSVHEIGEAASKVAAMSQVRRVLVDRQREFANREPGAVLDGRDIGTIVCPGAEVKIYVDASPEVRAKRRHAEIENNGGSASYENILADVQRRDARDSQRADSPLKPAADALLLDTSEMDIEAAFQTAKSLIDRVVAVKGNT